MKYFWFFFLAFTLLLREATKGRPEWTERVYSRGVFAAWRAGFDFLTGWLPFPATYLLFGALLWLLAREMRFLFFNREHSATSRLLRSGRRLLVFVSATISLFYWMWGFHYQRIPIETQLAIPDIQISVEDLKNALDSQTVRVLALRRQLQADTALPISATNHIPEAELEQMTRAEVAQCLKGLSLPAPGRPRGRQPFWKGFLLRFGAAGIYNVFSGESNTDRGLYFLTQPYNLAHEFCHAYGWADEGTCNFLAYIALEQSRRPLLHYSAELAYWRELAGAWRQHDREAYRAWALQRLPSGFREDLLLIRKQLDQYPEFFESFRYTVYDNYLKAQGIGEGMANYDKVIPLVMAWKRKR